MSREETTVEVDLDALHEALTEVSEDLESIEEQFTTALQGVRQTLADIRKDLEA